MHYTLNVSQIRPFVENERNFRKFCHGGTTWNSIPRSTNVTDFSKTFLVFYKWPDLTDVQGILRGTVRVKATTEGEISHKLSEVPDSAAVHVQSSPPQPELSPCRRDDAPTRLGTSTESRRARGTDAGDGAARRLAARADSRYDEPIR